MMRDFSKRQRSIIDFILRLSWGCGKKTAIIPHQKDFELAGIDKTKIKAELDWLIKAKVIMRDVTGREYAFNKNYDEWKVSIVPLYNKDRLYDLVALNLNSCQKSNIVAEKATEKEIIVDEKATGELTKKQLLNEPNPTDSSVESASIENLVIENKEIEVVVDVRAKESEIFKFYEQNIGLITRFHTELIGQYLDEGMEPDAILAILQDSIGKGNSWDWIKKVLDSSAKCNIKTKDQYEAKKLDRANAKSRDKPPNKIGGNKPPQTGNFEQRKHSDDYFENVYKEV